jgi:transketolase
VVLTCAQEWDELFASYSEEYPELADHLDKMQRRQLPDGWDADLPEYPADPKGAAGRDTNQKVLNLIAQRVPWLIGGSSDLAPSNKSRLTFEGAGDFQPDNRAGRNLHFGVREHAAGAITNGTGAQQDQALPGRILDLLRLSARGSAVVRTHGATSHPCLHPRLDRRR